jgi:hypothetical protein
MASSLLRIAEVEASNAFVRTEIQPAIEHRRIHADFISADGYNLTARRASTER